jgi:hypothetical protein
VVKLGVFELVHMSMPTPCYPSSSAVFLRRAKAVYFLQTPKTAAPAFSPCLPMMIAPPPLALAYRKTDKF